MVTESSGNGYALYGGVKLPNIDEVYTDELKQTHPYAFIIYNTAYACYRLFFFNGSISWSGAYVFYFSGAYSYYTLVDGAWTFSDSQDSGYHQHNSDGNWNWSNFDLKGYSSDDLYFAASDPTPLDGMNVIEWDGDTEGLEVVDFGTWGVFVKVSDTAPSYEDMMQVEEIEGMPFYNWRLVTTRYGYTSWITPFDGGVVAFDDEDTDLGFKLCNPFNPDIVYALSVFYTADGVERGLYFAANTDGESFTTLLAYTPATEDDTAETPTFTVNLSGAYTYTQGDTADTLSVTAEVSDGGTITYQWFMDDAEISGATDSGYTPATDTVGTRTYFCRVTNTLESGLTASADSDAVTVKVKFDIRGFVTGYLLTLAKGLLTVAAREPVAYLYNGVQLPALPEWDRESYPYAVIGYMVNSPAVYGYPKYLAVVDNAEYRTYDGKLSVTGFGALGCTTDKNSEWREWTEIDGIAVAHLLWANHDVLYTSGAGGTLYLAASDPVPVGETPPKRLKGYSYNGVILPAPPEYDAETYPYALIVYRDDLTTPVYEFFAYASDAEWDLSTYKTPRFGYNAAYLYGKAYPTISTGVAPVTWGWQESGESGNPTSKSKNVIWANFTGEYNGTVYWEASDEPTPIYE